MRLNSSMLNSRNSPLGQVKFNRDGMVTILPLIVITKSSILSYYFKSEQTRVLKDRKNLFFCKDIYTDAFGDR